MSNMSEEEFKKFVGDQLTGMLRDVVRKIFKTLLVVMVVIAGIAWVSGLNTTLATFAGFFAVWGFMESAVRYITRQVKGYMGPVDDVLFGDSNDPSKANV